MLNAHSSVIPFKSCDAEAVIQKLNYHIENNGTYDALETSWMRIENWMNKRNYAFSFILSPFINPLAIIAM